MKKNIIMMIIILICSSSLLYVMYIIKSKDIYYVSENNNSNIELTMKLGNTEITSFSDLDSSKYYRIDTDNTSCNNTSTKLYWSNSSKKLKVSGVTTGLKCSIAFEEITEDVNILAITIDNTLVESVPTSGIYSITYDCDNNDGTASDATVSWDNDAHKLITSNISRKTYCTINFHTETYSDSWKTWAQYAGISPNNYSSLQDMMNNSDIASILINNTAASNYLITQSSLMSSIKSLSNYASTLVPLFLNTKSLTAWQRAYNRLPVYVVDTSHTTYSIGGIYLYGYSSTTNDTYPFKSYPYYCLQSSYSENTAYYGSVFTSAYDGYSKLKYDIITFSNYSLLTCNYYFGIATSLSMDNNFNGNYITLLTRPSEISVSVPSTHTLDVSSITNANYLKFVLYHGNESGGNTCYLGIKSIIAY